MNSRHELATTLAGWYICIVMGWPGVCAALLGSFGLLMDKVSQDMVSDSLNQTQVALGHYFRNRSTGHKTRDSPDIVQPAWKAICGEATKHEKDNVTAGSVMILRQKSAVNLVCLHARVLAAIWRRPRGHQAFLQNWCCAERREEIREWFEGVHTRARDGQKSGPWHELSTLSASN